MIRLPHPNGTPVYLTPSWVVAIQQAHNGLTDDAVVTATSAVHWLFPSGRPDRVSVGMISICTGTPDDVAAALGFKPPETPNGPTAKLV